jgi:hypothetical protein
LATCVDGGSGEVTTTELLQCDSCEIKAIASANCALSSSREKASGLSEDQFWLWECDDPVLSSGDQTGDSCICKAVVCGSDQELVVAASIHDCLCDPDYPPPPG